MSFKRLKSSDVFTIPIVVNKNFTYVIQEDLTPDNGDNTAFSFYKGVTLGGTFNPKTDPKNTDGTYERLLYDEINQLFYQTYNQYDSLNTQSLARSIYYESASADRPTGSYYNFNDNPYIVKNFPTKSESTNLFLYSDPSNGFQIDPESAGGFVIYDYPWPLNFLNSGSYLNFNAATQSALILLGQIPTNVDVIMSAFIIKDDNSEPTLYDSSVPSEDVGSTDFGFLIGSKFGDYSGKEYWGSGVWRVWTILTKESNTVPGGTGNRIIKDINQSTSSFAVSGLQIEKGIAPSNYKHTSGSVVTDINKNIIRVIKINRNIFGEGLGEETLALYNDIFSTQDDGWGNFQFIDEDDNVINIGNIFYKQGIIVITDPDYKFIFQPNPNAIDPYYRLLNTQVSKSLLDILKNSYVDTGIIDYDSVGLFNNGIFPSYEIDHSGKPKIFNIILPPQTDILEITPGDYSIGFDFSSINGVPSNVASVNLEIYSDPLEVSILSTTSSLIVTSSTFDSITASFIIDKGVPPYNYNLIGHYTIEDFNKTDLNLSISSGTINSWYQPKYSTINLFAGFYTLKIIDRFEEEVNYPLEIYSKINLSSSVDYSDPCATYYSYFPTGGVDPYIFGITNGTFNFTQSSNISNSILLDTSISQDGTVFLGTTDSEGSHVELHNIPLRGRTFRYVGEFYESTSPNFTYSIASQTDSPSNSVRLQLYNDDILIIDKLVTVSYPSPTIGGYQLAVGSNIKVIITQYPTTIFYMTKVTLDSNPPSDVLVAPLSLAMSSSVTLPLTFETFNTIHNIGILFN